MTAASPRRTGSSTAGGVRSGHNQSRPAASDSQEKFFPGVFRRLVPAVAAGPGPGVVPQGRRPVWKNARIQRGRRQLPVIGIRVGGRRGSRCRRWKDRAEGRDHKRLGGCELRSRYASAVRVRGARVFFFSLGFSRPIFSRRVCVGLWRPVISGVDRAGAGWGVSTVDTTTDSRTGNGERFGVLLWCFSLALSYHVRGR